MTIDLRCEDMVNGELTMPFSHLSSVLAHWAISCVLRSFNPNCVSRSAAEARLLVIPPSMRRCCGMEAEATMPARETR